MIDHYKRQFIEPAAEFGPMPFWFWNDELSGEEIIRQIREFHAEEVTGFVIHPRMGLPRTMPYLSAAYMDLVETAVAEAARLGMSVILYDEGMYPSGAANGLVVRRNPGFASRGLAMKEYPCGGSDAAVSPQLEPGETIVSVQAVRKLPDGGIAPESTGILSHGQDGVYFPPPDEGEWSILVFVEVFSGGTIRGIHHGQDDGEPDAPKAADLLNPAAMQTFIELTHDVYYERLHPYFGSTIIGMFTDEPDLLGRGHQRGLMPWTHDFLGEYIACGGREQDLSALWFEAGEESARIRRRFEDAVRSRLTQTYYKPLSEWCEAHGIALTGHPAGSGDIGLLEHFQIPGQDVVWRWVAPEDGKALDGPHTVLAKCSSDAARHRGRRRNLNECFGVCGKGNGWSLTADDMKWYLDYLFVRGVNLIVPHAFYYSIREERRDERPPDVGMNNIWWPHYAEFARYIKRMSWLMTDARNGAEVAVLAKAAELPFQIVKPLYERQIEFNYLEEALLTGASCMEGAAISIAGYRYKAVLIENGSRFEPESLQMLAAFARQGGIVIELQEADRTDIGGSKADQGSRSAEHAAGWHFIKQAADIPALLDRLSLTGPLLEPAGTSVRISKMVKGSAVLMCIVNEGDDMYDGSLSVPSGKGMELWHPWTGTIEAVFSRPCRDGTNRVPLRLQRRECLIVAVDPSFPGVAVESTPAGIMQHEEQIPLQRGWRVDGLDGVGGKPIAAELPALSSWTEWEGLTHFSGALTYENRFELSGTAVDGTGSVLLDLGDVGEIARVTVNGQDAGVRMWKPYVFDISPYVRPAVNELRVEVTNSLACRYDRRSMPSGLLGPVTLCVANGQYSEQSILIR